MSNAISDRRLALRTAGIVIAVTVSVVLYLIGWPMFLDGVRGTFRRYAEPDFADWATLIAGAAMIGVVPGAWIGASYWNSYVEIDEEPEATEAADAS